MKKMVSVSLVILSLCAAGSALSPLGVHYPLGMPTNAVSGPSASMAGSGTAVIDEYNGASLNPANMAIGSRAAFSALVSYDRTGIKEGSKSGSVSGYSPKLLSLILPLGASSNISFAMQKQYDANLNVRDTKDTSSAVADITHAIERQNRGGLTSWQAGWGYRFNNRMSVGVVYERLFFNSESRFTLESSSIYLNGDKSTGSYSEIENSSFSSNGVRFGFQIPVHEKVTAGMSAQYVFYADKTGSADLEYRHDNDKPYEQSNEKFSVHLPPSISAGLSYELNDKWLFALDLHSTIWSYYDNENWTKIPDDLRTTFGLAFGTSFIPAANKLGGEYWETIRYRAGVRYSQLPLKESQEYVATIGTGLPIPNDGGLVDIIFGFGMRSGKYSDYKEYLTKFELGINGGRNWFQKTATRNY